MKMRIEWGTVEEFAGGGQARGGMRGRREILNPPQIL